MKTFIYISSLILMACSNSAPDTSPKSDSLKKDGTIMQDTAVMQKDSAVSAVTTNFPNGIYQVGLPCSDCKTLQHTIAFYPDKTFRLEEEKWGKTQTLSKIKGNWSITNNTLSLYQDHLVVSQYNLRGDSLLYISGSKEYALNKLPAATGNDVWRKEQKKGITFFGVGNEPFWNIEISDREKIAFHLAEWGKPLQYKPANPVRSGDSLVYTTANDSGTLHVAIYDQFCSDGMSDFIYNNKVKVVYKGRVFNGCGLLYN
jgi:uncharacterized membrane protein